MALTPVYDQSNAFPRAKDALNRIRLKYASTKELDVSTPEEVVEYMREISMLCPPHSQEYKSCLSALTHLLWLRVLDSAEQADLEEAIAAHDAVLVIQYFIPRHENDAGLAFMFALSSDRQFESSKQRISLDKIIFFYRQALGLRPKSRTCRVIDNDNIGTTCCMTKFVKRCG